VNRKWGAFCLGQLLGYVAVGLSVFQTNEIARLSFLVAGIALLLGPLVIAGAAAVLRIYRDRFPNAERLARVTDAAGQLGLRSYVHDTFPLMPVLPSLPVQAADVRFQWVWAGAPRGRETRIFDLWYREPDKGGETGTAHELTCALLSLDAPVPVVAIKRAYFGRRSLGIGSKRALATGDDRFDKRFELLVGEHDSVTRVLTDRVRATLRDDKTLELAQIGESVLYCSRRIDFGPRRELLERATRLHDSVR
jgi:hypothetical protein